MKNNLNALNNYLFEELERLNDDETLDKEDNLQKELKRAKAIFYFRVVCYKSKRNRENVRG